MLLCGVEACVDRSVAVPLFREIFEGEDRRDRADRDARAAINALRRIDVKLVDLFVLGLVFARVDAIDGTDIHASGVFCADAGLSDYVRHSNLLKSEKKAGSES
jgi:hypothetical protein